MSFSLILNNTNSIGGNNNTFQYNFTKGNFTIPDGSEIMLTNIQVPYAFYNITTAYGNNTFSFAFPTGTNTYTTTTITIPDGFYTTTTLNYYLQQWMIGQGYYLINSSGQYVYYYAIVYNTTYYGNQLLAFPVPTSLPSGYTAPSNWVGFPTVSRCPYLTLPSGGISSFLGFASGQFPTANTTSSYSLNSTITPIGSTVNSIIIRCSLVNNKVSSQFDLLDSFPISNAQFGANINYSPNTEKYITLSQGNFSSFTITLCDQNLNPIISLDNNVLITLLFRFPKK